MFELQVWHRRFEKEYGEEENATHVYEEDNDREEPYYWAWKYDSTIDKEWLYWDEKQKKYIPERNS